MTKTLSTMSALNSNAVNFSLADTNAATQGEQQFASFDFSEINPSNKGFLIAFICNHCPYVVHIANVLADVFNDAQNKSLKVAAINSNDVRNYPADSPEKMTLFAQKYGFNFPYLYDEDQSVAKAYTAACTPDFFLYDHNAKLVYRGQFDAARPGNSLAVTGSDLTGAISQLLNGQTVNTNQIASVGCNIKWQLENAPEYFS